MDQQPSLPIAPAGPVAGPAAAALAAIGVDEFAFFQGLVQGMRCGILTTDRQGRIILLNELAQTILDLSEMPAPGTPARQALAGHPDLVQMLEERSG